jgi:hypothetical protein
LENAQHLQHEGAEHGNHLPRKLIMTPKEYQRNARWNCLQEYDSFAKPDDFIEVTEWYNGEGFDVHLSTSAGEQRMSFSWGEYQALRATLGDWAENNLEDEE